MSKLLDTSVFKMTVEQEDGSLELKSYASCIKWFYEDTPILSKELTEDGQAWRLHGKLRMFEKEEDLASDEYVQSMKDWTIYLSTYDETFIGTEKEWKCFSERGFVLYQGINKSSKSSSIAYCPKENKWYGWSHRAIHGFTIGDVVKEGDCTATSGIIKSYLIQHPEADLSLPVGYEATTMERAKRMAIAFADSVS